jgi:hypothetical protein
MILPDVPKVQDIPGLPEFLGTKAWMLSDVAKYIGDLWHSKQGECVLTPRSLQHKDASEICSLVLAYKEKYSQFGKDVQIKKVAEIRGSRYNSGKPRFDLLDPIAQHGLVAVLGFGATKYADHNWRKGLPYMEIIASMQRHIMAIAAGQDFDDETGLMHADHIQCNAMFLSNMMKTRPDMDDRWKPPVASSAEPADNKTAS